MLRSSDGRPRKLKCPFLEDAIVGDQSAKLDDDQVVADVVFSGRRCRGDASLPKMGSMKVNELQQRRFKILPGVHRRCHPRKTPAPGLHSCGLHMKHVPTDLGPHSSILYQTKDHKMAKHIFPFRALPAELRLRIYAYALPSDKHYKRALQQEARFGYCRNIALQGIDFEDMMVQLLPSVTMPSLLGVCKLIYQESKPIFYAKNNFNIRLVLLCRPVDDVKVRLEAMAKKHLLEGNEALLERAPIIRVTVSAIWIPSHSTIRPTVFANICMSEGWVWCLIGATPENRYVLERGYDKLAQDGIDGLVEVYGLLYDLLKGVRDGLEVKSARGTMVRSTM